MELFQLVKADINGHTLFKSLDNAKTYYMQGICGFVSEILNSEGIEKALWTEPEEAYGKMVFPSLEDASKYAVCLISRAQLGIVDQIIHENGGKPDQLQAYIKEHYEMQIREHSDFRWLNTPEKDYLH
ncbi:MAG TPA: hypothetical protein VJ461_02400 [Candidatus Nanoarchaeia archaeon]|nr:hypothetical protein [Candidatus Nanoarchaeia archaeon]